MDESKTPTSFADLPNELLAHILSCFDAPHPSASSVALHDEPVYELTHSSIVDLKSVSGVSPLWRQEALPLLFKNARFIVPKPDRDSPTLITQIRPFLDFVQLKSLSQVIKTFVLVVQHPNVDSILHPASSYKYGSFWQSLFDTIDPVELVIVAPPKALAALSSCRIATRHVNKFDCPYHYMRLQRPSRPPTSSSASNIYSNRKVPRKETFSSTKTSITRLLRARPWCAMLLNEGSFIKAFSTAESWMQNPPSILPDLVGEPPRAAIISPTIRDFEYIAIFPTQLHLAKLTDNIPRLDRLYIQLVPRNDILDDPQKMEMVEPNDLWLERNQCYAQIMRQLFTSPPAGNYEHLKVFESGDAADADAWKMAVEYVKRAGIPWHVVRDGVFEKDAQGAPVAKAEDAYEDFENVSAALVHQAVSSLFGS